MHGAAYINGLFAGLLLETDYLDRIKKDFLLFQTIKNIFTTTKLALFSLSVIMLFRGVLYSTLPFISAIESSLFSSLFSLLFCYYLLRNKVDTSLRQILTLSLFKKLRKCLRVSYLLHPVTFMIIISYFPITNLSITNTIIHSIITLTINYLVALVIYEHLEKHVLKAGARLSKWTFNT